jgi:hypothetical protein
MIMMTLKNRNHDSYHVARREKDRNSYNISVKEPEEKK